MQKRKFRKNTQAAINYQKLIHTFKATQPLAFFMPDKTENYNYAILFLLSINETDVNLMEIGDFDKAEVWGLLGVLDDRRLIDLSKTHAFITGKGSVHLKTHLLELENKLIDFIKRKETDISKSVNITEFMEANFIKPNPKSKRTSNDRDLGVYFIKYLKSKGRIKYDEINLSHVNYWCIDGGDNPTIKRWFHNLEPPLHVALKNQSELEEFQAEILPIIRPNETQITPQIKKSKSDTWLVKIFNKIIDNIILTIVTIVGTVIGGLLLIMVMNYLNHKGFKL